jgi:hypothetical protein
VKSAIISSNWPCVHVHTISYAVGTSTVSFRSVLWDVMHHGPFWVNQRFRGAYRLHLDDYRVRPAWNQGKAGTILCLPSSCWFLNWLMHCCCKIFKSYIISPHWVPSDIHRWRDGAESQSWYHFSLHLTTVPPFAGQNICLRPWQLLHPKYVQLFTRLHGHIWRDHNAVTELYVRILISCRLDGLVQSMTSVRYYTTNENNTWRQCAP